jgi:hypothetical protein
MSTPWKHLNPNNIPSNENRNRPITNNCQFTRRPNSDENRYFATLWNKMIREQRMINEWDVGYVSNHHRIFLGCWPYNENLFPVCYENCVMLANWRFDRRGEALQTLTMYLEKLEN